MREKLLQDLQENYDYGRKTFPVKFDAEVEREVVDMVKAAMDRRGGFAKLSKKQREARSIHYDDFP